MDNVELYEQCVYTTRGVSELHRLRTTGAPLIEGKWWAEGQRMLARAQRQGKRLPVVFSDGAEGARLVGWALVDSIERDGDGTAVHFSEWRPIHGPRTQELIKTDREPIAEGYIRPYALCLTPWFIQSPPSEHSVSEQQRAWLIKGSEARNDFTQKLVPMRRGRWRTARPPRDWNDGDFAFMWESSPGSRLIGLARISSTDAGSKGQERFFDLEYLTGFLSHPPTLRELRGEPRLRTASFLKAGPAGTVFPLTAAQAHRLAELVADVNPSCKVVLEDHLLGRGTLSGLDAEHGEGSDWLDPEDLAFFEHEFDEGRKRLITHVIRERDRRAREQAMRAYRLRTGGTACSICSFDFEQVYGEIGVDFAEVHHAGPLALRPEEGGPTRLRDLVVVCANCHRMLHRRRDWLTVESLSQLLSQSSTARSG